VFSAAVDLHSLLQPDASSYGDVHASSLSKGQRGEVHHEWPVTRKRQPRPEVLSVRAMDQNLVMLECVASLRTVLYHDLVGIGSLASGGPTHVFFVVMYVPTTTLIWPAPGSPKLCHLI